MKQNLKSFMFRAASSFGLLALRRHRTRVRFRIVTYHGVDAVSHPVINFDRLQTDPNLFSRQLESLARAFQVVELHEAVSHFIEHRVWPERGLAITFDDGYRNNLEIAVPILKRLGMPATFFVTAGFIQRRNTPWWYELRRWLAQNDLPLKDAVAKAIAYESRFRPMNETTRNTELAKLGVSRGGESFYPLMTIDECRRLMEMGFDVQCHGDTHASFAGESAEDVRQEIRKSAEFIQLLGIKPWGLAYPYGHEPKNITAARDEMESCGLVSALTTNEGANGLDADLWRLRRWDMHGGYSALGALARIS